MWKDKLASQMDPDVLIIGGGVIGLSIARELHKTGVDRILLIEKAVCGAEASWAAAGMLSPQAETDDTGSFFDLCSASRDMYPGFSAELAAETGVEIGLDRQGTLYLAFSNEDHQHLLEKYKYQQQAGLDLEYLSREQVIDAEPNISPDVIGGLLFSNDWQVDNRKLCEALIKYAAVNNVEIRENTAALNVLVESGRVNGVETNVGPIKAGTVILAAGAWSSVVGLGDGALPFDIKPVRGQILEFTTSVRSFRHVIYTPTGYIVPRADGRVLAGSTTEHAGFVKEVTENARTHLGHVAKEISPLLTDSHVTGSWSGLRPFVADGLPVLGPMPGGEGLIIAAGHYRSGILLAPITGKMIADLVTGESNADNFLPFGVDRFLTRRAGVA